MIGGDHDPDHRSWLTLGPRGLAVAAGDAAAQVVVSGICQFDALEDPEDRPPSVVLTMLSGLRPGWLVPGRIATFSHSRILEPPRDLSPILPSGVMRLTHSISWFSRNRPASRRSAEARHAAYRLVTDHPGR